MSGHAVAAAAPAAAKSKAAVAAGLALGAALTWNITNTGAVAEPLAQAYGSSLAAVGLLTTALFVTHLLAQIPGGIVADRVGPRNLAVAAIGLIVVGDVIVLSTDELALALIGRLVVGLGTGSGFVAGLDLIRAGGGGPLAQGFFGGVTTAAAGLALMVVPSLHEAAGWRAPYWSSLALAVGAAAVVAATRPVGRVPGSKAGLLADRRLPLGLVPLGLLHAATFGLNVVAANWIVTLLERQGLGAAVAGLAGGTILLIGVLSRPAGGFVVARGIHRPLTAVCLVTTGAAALALAAGASPLLSALAAFVIGTTAGLPWVGFFIAAQRLRPDRPAAAIGVVNAIAALTILVGTPLIGLTFDHVPGDGRVGFLAIAALSVAALAAWRRAPLP